MFNAHFIFILFTRHYPSIKEAGMNIFEIKIKLNYYYLFCIMIFIVALIFFAHFAYFFNGIETELSSKYHSYFYESFVLYYIYLYLLTFIFLATVAVHVWYNLSISYPIMLFLIRKKCIDLRNRSQYIFFLKIKNYFAETSCLYLILLIGTIVTYKMPDKELNILNLIAHHQYEPIVLAAIFLLNVTLNFFCFIQLHSLVQDYVSNKYQKIYTQFNKGKITLEDTDKQYPVLDNIANPFKLRSNSIFIIAEIVLLGYILNPIVLLILKLLFRIYDKG
ncbi:MAG: hypothetical protein PHY05_12030 [Methanothrix sp.]|nr:hypothetical protein [Methanothrix sp.]